MENEMIKEWLCYDYGDDTPTVVFEEPRGSFGRIVEIAYVVLKDYDEEKAKE